MAVKAGSKVKFSLGPMKSVKETTDPYDASAKDTLQAMINMYIPEPGQSCWQSRPGMKTTNDVAALGTLGHRYGNEIIEHVDSSGTIRAFAICGGSIYRWNGSTSAPAWPDVSPTDVTSVNIANTSVPIFATPFGDTLLINDGVHQPWIMSGLGDTNVTGTRINYTNATTLLSRGSTDTRVASIAFAYQIPQASATTKAAVAAGTALAAGTIPQDKWGIYRYSIATGGTINSTAGAANFGAGYATEALAIAALPSVPASEWNMGYVTVQTKVGSAFIGGTDALFGGASGNVANATNYYTGFSAPWTANGAWAVWNDRPQIIVASVAAVTTAFGNVLTWGEVAAANTGYQQTGYDNNWALTQVDNDTIFGVAAVEGTLYAVRANAVTVITGTSMDTIRTQATREGIEGVGSTSPKSFWVWNNALYIVDRIGRPWKIRPDRTLVPLWEQMRSITEAFTAAQIATLNTTAYVRIFPAYNLVFFKLVDTTKLYVFRLDTDEYFDYWTLQVNTETMDAMGLVRDSNKTPQFLILGTATALSGYVYRITQLAEAITRDTTLGITAGVAASFSTDWIYVDPDTGIYLTDVILQTASTTVVACSVTGTYGTASTNATPAAPPGTGFHRAGWSKEQQGDFLKLTFSQTTGASAYFKAYKVMLEGKAIALDVTAA